MIGFKHSNLVAKTGTSLRFVKSRTFVFTVRTSAFSPLHTAHPADVNNLLWVEQLRREVEGFCSIILFRV